MTRTSQRGVSRRATHLLATLALAAGVATPSLAQDASGELVILNWQGGAEGDMWEVLEDAFVEQHPEISIRELEVTVQGDARGPMRTALLSGEVVDLIINTWPAFRRELAESGIIQPIDDLWQEYQWDEQLSQSWRDLGAVDDETYGLTYTYGYRSGIWYETDHMEQAGIDAPPATWEEFLDSFDALRGAGFEAPVAMPAKYWAHAEWFESLLLRTAGVEFAAQLAVHEVPWTDPQVKETLMTYAQMLEAGCCGSASQMFANDWDGEADQIFQADNKNYLLIGMWMNGRAKSEYGLEEGVDYSLFEFPDLGKGHDDTASVDAKELVLTTNGNNPEAAELFLDFMLSETAADILHENGYASPSNEADTSLLGPAQQIATEAVSGSQVQFVLGDLLPGDFVDEYRVQLQRFLQDPTEDTVDSVLQALEEQAQSSY
ncbi:sugar ABC transporter substrate-binding protein [Devosia pacifica]|uniref:Sugar ABC transporter substrate-binding protein n=1 Tax=Devosia pacifica TaxID=1335967 RepID=A0A918VSU0_9HYPH|nr:extracellular solute-binding protein [Devosia pacifica]GHA21591.1 sugar ABC transporter substrate-binding protein [Devosia pacifica]